MQEIQSDGYFVDYNFIDQYQLELLAGRKFAREFATDLRQAMVINESALRSMGYRNPEDIIGKRFTQATAGGNGTVIGVVKDFHYHSSREAVRPLTMRVSPGFLTFLTISISSDNVQSVIRNLENKWKDLAPGMPMVYYFMDDVYNDQYRAEERFGKLFLTFASIAIFISCLGLYGLSVFSTAQRTREIGIRKVLGASISGITTMLAGDFVKLVVVAFAIASPVAWWLGDAWLNDFAYRIHLSWWMFALAGFSALMIAILTVSFMSVKAAMSNPVKSLRNE